MSDQENSEDIAVLKEQVHALKSSLEDVAKEIAEFRKTLTSGKGFLLGIGAVLAPLWAIALSLVGNIFDKVFGNWGN